MEQRRRPDIASLFNPIPGMGVGMNMSDMAPYSHYPSHFSYQGAGALSQAEQYSSHPYMALHMQELSSQSNLSNASAGPSNSLPLPLPQQLHYPAPNLGTAVSSSMHLTNSSHDSDIGVSSGFKMDSDMMYYSVSS